MRLGDSRRPCFYALKVINDSPYFVLQLRGRFRGSEQPASVKFFYHGTFHNSPRRPAAASATSETTAPSTGSHPGTHRRATRRQRQPPAVASNKVARRPHLHVVPARNRSANRIAATTALSWIPDDMHAPLWCAHAYHSASSIGTLSFL
jgi:hypothetical protein